MEPLRPTFQLTTPIIADYKQLENEALLNI